MVERYTIGALARAAEVPTTTIRYYERAGLLPPEGRSGGNYRAYTERSLERLLFIRAAQANGFTLDDVKRLLQFQDGELDPCKEVQSLIEARLLDLEQRLKQLRTVRGVLRASLDACHRGAASGRCKVLEGLAEGRSVRRREPGGRGRKARIR
jgi:MerR family mercuric resistance operon transcriptional regulator